MTSSGVNPPEKTCAACRVRKWHALVEAVERLAHEPLPHGSQKLAGSERTYRIRVGDYRVVYEVFTGSRVVEIQRVRHRKDVYRS